MVERARVSRWRARSWAGALLAATLAVVAVVAAACGEGDDDATTSSSGEETTSPTTSSASPTSPYPSSPTDVATAWREMDGLFAPSILQAPTVGLDPFAIRGDPADLFAEVDVERMVADIRALSDQRGEEDPGGLAAAAELVEDGFRDAGYRVRLYPELEPDGGATTTREGDETTTSVGDEGAADSTTATTDEGDTDSGPTDDGAYTPAMAVSVPGEDCSDRDLLIVAPYDAPTGSPGARAASATAGLLELARLVAEHPLPMSVTFLAVPFGAEDPSANQVAEVIDGLELDPDAVLVLEGLGVAAPDADDDNLTGLAPGYLLFVGEQESSYVARTTSLSTARFLPNFWAFTAVAELPVFPEFDDRFSSPWWDEGYQALLVTDPAARADDRVGTEDDEPTLIDEDFLANSVRAVLAAVVGAGTIDTDADLTPDFCQRDW